MEIAQDMRKKEVKHMMANQTQLTAYFSPIQPVHKSADRYDNQSISYIASSRDAWAQQDLRQLLLHATRNVRFRNMAEE